MEKLKGMIVFALLFSAVSILLTLIFLPKRAYFLTECELAGHDCSPEEGGWKVNQLDEVGE